MHFLFLSKKNIHLDTILVAIYKYFRFFGNFTFWKLFF